MKPQNKTITRYNAASPTEFAHHASRLPMRYLCRTLNRSQRTIRRWLDGSHVIPPWAIAVLRLRRHLEHELLKDQMGISASNHQRAHQDAKASTERRPAADEHHYAVQLTLDMGAAG
jgi:hypothetical protein